MERSRVGRTVATSLFLMGVLCALVVKPSQSERVRCAQEVTMVDLRVLDGRTALRWLLQMWHSVISTSTLEIMTCEACEVGLMHGG